MCFKSVRKKSVYFFPGEIKGTVLVFYRLSTIHGTIEVIVLMRFGVIASGVKSFWYILVFTHQRASKALASLRICAEVCAYAQTCQSVRCSGVIKLYECK